MLEEAGQIKNTVVLIFRHIECLHVMNFPMDWNEYPQKIKFYGVYCSIQATFQTIFPFLWLCFDELQLQLPFFLLNFCTRFHVYKNLFGIFFIIILFRSWVIYKCLKRSGFYTVTEIRFLHFY